MTTKRHVTAAVARAVPRMTYVIEEVLAEHHFVQDEMGEQLGRIFGEEEDMYDDPLYSAAWEAIYVGALLTIAGMPKSVIRARMLKSIG